MWKCVLKACQCYFPRIEYICVGLYSANFIFWQTPPQKKHLQSFCKTNMPWAQMQWFKQFWFREIWRRSDAIREPWSSMKDVVHAQSCEIQELDSKSSDSRWWKCLNYEQYCPVSRCDVSWMLQTLILNILNDSCFGRWIHCASLKRQHGNGGGFCSTTLKKSSWTNADSTYSMYCSLPVINIHIHGFIHLKRAIKDVWPFSLCSRRLCTARFTEGPEDLQD